MRVLKGEPAQRTKDGRGSCLGKVAAKGIIETGKGALITNNIRIQRGDAEEDDNSVAICTSTPNSKSLAVPANEELVGLPPETSGPGSVASPVFPYYSVGEGVSLPFSQLLPQCSFCSCNALIAWSGRSDPKENGFACLSHGLQVDGRRGIRDLMLDWDVKRRYSFISPEHEAALRAFFA